MIDLCCIKSTSLIHYIYWLFIVHQCYLQKIAFCSNYTYHHVYLTPCNALRGYCTPDQFFDCLCIFLKNYNTLVTSKICFL